jgi:hypothetical protein
MMGAGMHIITCYKLDPEEQHIAVKSDSTLSFDRAAWKILLTKNGIPANRRISFTLSKADHQETLSL